MRMAIWAPITLPPPLFAAVRLDGCAAMVSIFGGVPLALQQWAELTEILPAVLLSTA